MVLKLVFRIFTLILFFIIHLNTTAAGKPETTGKPCLPCEELKGLRLPDVTILEAIEFKPEPNENHNKDKAHCKVLGVIGKEINFELLLPLDWNGRFAMGGGGGFVGSIQNGVRYSLDQGYATSGTDTGHKGFGVKADWALNNLERQLNFGHLAVHRTAEVSKVLIYHFYCEDPEYSYFVGCSRGGGQAMMEAQRYPDDFDGIIAMAPAFNWTEFGAEFIQNMKALYPDPDNLQDPVLTIEHLKFLHQSVVNSCDQIDGVKDNIINDPRDCNFKVRDLPLCENAASIRVCFNMEQIHALEAIYQGIVIDDKKVYPGFPLGGEGANAGWINWIVGPDPSLKLLDFPSLQYGFGTEIFKYLVFNDPDWDYAAYDFSGFFEDTRFAASYLNATNTDYSEFKENRGKIILVHGWEDAALSAYATIEHYEAVRNLDPEVADYMKLYLLPGVYHCGGGPGPSDTDWLDTIRSWVEEEQEPDRIVVSKKLDGGGILSRPVYPYPRKAQYDGEGDPYLETSFK